MSITAARTAGTAAEVAAATETELLVEGMTCGACAARVERALRKLGEVEASVNYGAGVLDELVPAASTAVGSALALDQLLCEIVT